MKSQFEIEKSIRKEWGFNPATRKIESKKRYNRNAMKNDIRKGFYD